VHNNAEAAGIKAAWISIYFEGDDEGHACNAFQTVDRGLIYIDCTSGKDPGKVWSPEHGYYLYKLPPQLTIIGYGPDGNPIYGFTEENKEIESWDTVAYIEIGREYGLIDIANAKSLSYSFYEQYTQRWQEYEVKLEAYNREVERYNQEIRGKVYYEDSPEIARIEAWEARLEGEGQALDKLAEELGDYYYEPLGIVKDIHIHW